MERPNNTENLFRSKVLISNWFEDRSNHSNTCHSHFKERKDHSNSRFTLTNQEFNKTNNNWLNFQNMPSNETFKTIYNIEYKPPREQQRTSVIDPFLKKKGCMETNPQALEEYRRKWTKQPMVVDREYLGAIKK